MFNQIVAPLLRAFERLLFPPCGNLTVVAGEQYLRYFHSSKLNWSRILWPIKEVRLKRIRQQRFPITHSTGDQSDNSVHEHKSRELAAGQHVVADRNLSSDECFADPLIN